MSDSYLNERIDTVRRFNRFYTRQIGLLHEGILGSPYSLTEGRVLYELAHRQNPIANDVCRALDLDAGYVSRILRSFEKSGLIEKTASNGDDRRNLLSLTRRGQGAFIPLDRRSHQQVADLLASLSETQQKALVGAMRTIESLLVVPGEIEKSNRSPYILRPHHPGDMGWVVHRQGLLYAEEYGYDERFEALAADIVAEFIQRYNPKRERCWIAEKDGEIVGSVFLVTQSEKVAKLRLLLVEPAARGMGIGGRLIVECARFARQAGYRKITLWTQSELLAARHLYKKAGFRLTRKKKHYSFGKHLVAETWELKLQ